MRVSSIKYRFCASVDPVAYDSFDIKDDCRLGNKSDVDPPRKSSPDGVEVALFSEPEHVPTKPKDGEGGLDKEEEDSRFMTYLPSVHMHNVDLSTDNALEFPDLPHRRYDHTGSPLDLGELKVGKEFSSKDSFLGALK
ncbi:hypothetical protein PVK06_028282 [Gossypium arboreum]|uniref:Uncharacterized protein n=1 Tax=Gossypium arboreum TaxID=29729 RepID=A0ABR0P2J4_GOSAR|nr:hypothetical protein PVK06_028282 [Gossypium arboreum]